MYAYNLLLVTKVVKVPTMADSISEGEISRWEKSKFYLDLLIKSSSPIECVRTYDF